MLTIHLTALLLNCIVYIKYVFNLSIFYHHLPTKDIYQLHFHFRQMNKHVHVWTVICASFSLRPSYPLFFHTFGIVNLSLTSYIKGTIHIFFLSLIKLHLLIFVSLSLPFLFAYWHTMETPTGHVKNLQKTIQKAKLGLANHRWYYRYYRWMLTIDNHRLFRVTIDSLAWWSYLYFMLILYKIYYSFKVSFNFIYEKFIYT